MIRDVALPQLAMGMSEGTIIEWLAKDGDRIEREQPLLVLETEKVTTELPAPYAGYFHPLVQPGVTVPVETILAKICDTEEEWRTVGDSTGDAAASQPSGAAQATVGGASGPVGVAGEERGGRIRASGLAKKLAAANGIALEQLSGSGPGGRIVRRDVLAAVAAKPSAPPPSVPPAVKVGQMTVRTRIPLVGMRKTIADRMVRAKTTAADTYGFFEIDATKLIAARQTMLSREEEFGHRVSLIAIYARAIALACRAVPICNATLVDNEIIVWDTVNVGIAVAMPGRTEYDSSLVVPVLRDVGNKGVLAISREIKEMVSMARAGKLTSEHMADGTITISSTAGFVPGAWGLSTPLLNLPQVVCFQPGTPIEKPVAVDGQVVVRSMLPCSLSFDHRAMDGEPVGRFCRKLADLLTNPELMTL